MPVVSHIWEGAPLLTVVMLTWEYPPYMVGGLARHVHALSRELAAQGHRVCVLTRIGPELPAEAEDGGVQILRVQPYFQEPQDFRLWVSHLNFALLEAGANLIRSLDGPVVLHAHDWLVAYAAKGLKHMYRLPLVATIHATEHGRHGGIHDSGQQYINDVEWWLTYEAWRVIVCSKAMRSEVQRLFNLGDDKVAVIPNGIDLKAGDPSVPREAFAAPGERLLFHIGRLVPEKGAAILLEAVALIRRWHRLRLVIGGVGPYREELLRRADAMGLQDCVTFAGWLEDGVVQAAYRYADAAVVPSTYEPFGIVALEALAAGTPLIVSDTGGLSEIVEHGVNGLKACPGDAASLAEQIDRLLKDRGLARRLATEGQRQMRERYSWRGVARATADVYAGVSASGAMVGWGPHPEFQPQPPTSGPLPGRYTV